MFGWIFYSLLIGFDGGSSIAAYRAGASEVQPWLRNPYAHVAVKGGGLPFLVKLDRKLGKRSKPLQWVARSVVAGLATYATVRNLRNRDILRNHR